MRGFPHTVYHRAMIILSSTSGSPADISSGPAEDYSYANLTGSSEFDFVGIAPIRSERQVLKTYFSSVAVLEQWELSQNYQELGEALNEMAALEGADEWRIEPSVYHAASYVAAKLREDSVPAPQIFTHGPESVVFNWSDDNNDNLYLTISANEISALISSPERITQRIDYSASQFLNPSHLLPFAHLGRPIILISRSDTDLPELIE
jgi:hypothetical protein